MLKFQQIKNKRLKDFLRECNKKHLFFSPPNLTIDFNVETKFTFDSCDGNPSWAVKLEAFQSIAQSSLTQSRSLEVVKDFSLFVLFLTLLYHTFLFSLSLLSRSCLFVS